MRVTSVLFLRDLGGNKVTFDREGGYRLYIDSEGRAGISDTGAGNASIVVDENNRIRVVED